MFTSKQFLEFGESSEMVLVHRVKVKGIMLDQSMDLTKLGDEG
jgi:hypothetical protein